MAKSMGTPPPRNKKTDQIKGEIRRIKFEHESFRPDPGIQRRGGNDQLGAYLDDKSRGFNNHMVRNNVCPVCGEEWIPYCNDDTFCAIPCDVGKAVLVCRAHKDILMGMEAPMSELKPCPFPPNEIADILETFIPEIEDCMVVYAYQRSALHGAVAELRRAQPTNEPLMLHFGRGELGVGTAHEGENGPPREINIRRLSAPLPIASPTGDKGKRVDELENVLVRMQFDNAESAHVLERAVCTVLAGFEQSSNEPLTLEELRGMDGEPVWMARAKEWVFVSTAVLEPYAQVWYFTSKGLAKTVLYHHERFYRHKPERSEDDE
ncbi:hypothetical protein [Oscillibacter sp.]|uniref:hypothetical protein n=1 Tax=Oscillibacter sp. TaxID=1945593 RepID=UPI0028981A1D|nr:hypothetical protein [Oscillibacter sp.]